MKKTLYYKGQFTLLGAIIAGATTMVASAIGAWATANSRVDSVDTKVQVIEERENNHYDELSRQLVNIDKKLDEIRQMK